MHLKDEVPEDGGNMVLWSNGILPEPRRPWFEQNLKVRFWAYELLILQVALNIVHRPIHFLNLSEVTLRCICCNSQTVAVTAELRRPVYMCVSACAVDFRGILSLMAKVNWEVKEVMSQHSQYVDILLRVRTVSVKMFFSLWNMQDTLVQVATFCKILQSGFVVPLKQWNRWCVIYRSCRYSACGLKKLQCVSQSHGKCMSPSGRTSSTSPATPLLRGEPEEWSAMLYRHIRGVEVENILWQCEVVWTLCGQGPVMEFLIHCREVVIFLISQQNDCYYNFFFFLLQGKTGQTCHILYLSTHEFWDDDISVRHHVCTI